MKIGLSLILAKFVANTLRPSGMKVGYDIVFAAFYRLLTQSGGASKSGHPAFYAVVAKCAKPIFIPPRLSGRLTAAGTVCANRKDSLTARSATAAERRDGYVVSGT